MQDLSPSKIFAQNRLKMKPQKITINHRLCVGMNLYRSNKLKEFGIKYFEKIQCFKIHSYNDSWVLK